MCRAIRCHIVGLYFRKILIDGSQGALLILYSPNLSHGGAISQSYGLFLNLHKICWRGAIANII